MQQFYGRRVILFLFLFFTISFVKAQDLDSLLNISAFTAESDLQKNLNKSLTVSSSKALSTREIPGIISLITSEEIQNSGARDLIDILRLVPGFDVGQDLQFVMGIGLRGNWANEGKVLVLMDGQPFNELLYQTVAIGNRFPVDAIEQIEIIRGPGSAIYGGSAEYGVINIKTKAAESLNGVAVYGTGGFHNDAVGRTNGGVMIAEKGETFSWDASFFKGRGIVSDQKHFQDPLQDTTALFQDTTAVNLAPVTKADPMNINAGFRYKGISLRTMYDDYQVSDPFLYTSFKNFYADLRYAWKLNQKITIIPQLKYYNQIPWSWGDRATETPSYRVRAQRVFMQLEAVWDVTRKLNINFGLVQFNDKATDLLNTGRFSGSNEMTLNNYAFFAQGLFKHRLANATVGFRYEKNNRYGAAFVPRLALTKKIENFHFKILYSQAFRAPSIENINIALNGTIKPERSNIFEFEFGYQFTPEMLLTVNAYSIVTKNILTYGTNGTGSDFTEWYTNSTKAGTKGFEVIYSIRKKSFYANATYSFGNSIGGDTTVQTYIAPQTNKQYIGMYMQKVTLNTNFYITKSLSFDPTFVYAGKRYAYTTVEIENGSSVRVVNKLDPYILLNAFLNHRNILPGLTAGVGVFDILNQRPAIPQAYNGGYAPIPGRSREFIVKVYYQINFKKQ